MKMVLHPLSFLPRTCWLYSTSPFTSSRFAVIFDVYVDDRQRVWIVDFNTFGPVTDGLLFSWEEIYALPTDDQHIDMRIVESEDEVRVSALQSARFPIEYSHGVDMSSAEAIENIVQMMRSGVLSK